MPAKSQCRCQRTSTGTEQKFISKNHTENAQKLHQLFFELRDRFHQTFIIVTHNEELAKLSDRCIVMRDGQISI